MSYENGKLYELPPDALQLDPNQPRKVVEQQALDELTASVARIGIVQPIIFRQGEAESLIVVAGERRLAAARAAGLATIPAVFIQGDYAEVALVENLLRQDLTPVEEAEALNTLMADRQYTQEQLAAIIGKAQNTVSEILSINRLPQEIRDDCRGNRAISRSSLINIAKKKQSRGMVTAYKAMKDKLGKGKVARRKKTSGTAQENIDRIAAFRKKLGELDVSTCSADEKVAFQQALSELRQAIEAILTGLAATDASSADAAAPATAGTKSSSRRKAASAS